MSRTNINNWNYLFWYLMVVIDMSRVSHFQMNAKYTSISSLMESKMMSLPSINQYVDKHKPISTTSYDGVNVLWTPNILNERWSTSALGIWSLKTSLLFPNSSLTQRNKIYGLIMSISKLVCLLEKKVEKMVSFLSDKALGPD